MKPAIFVTFEGGEGTGKSTQSKLLAARLIAKNIRHVLTREPGGTKEAEAIRRLLVEGAIDAWTSSEEALLNYAARSSHLRNVIRPALENGGCVLCDRFIDSTRAYQQYAGDCETSLIDKLEASIVGTTRPDLTFVFDMPVKDGLARAKSRESETEDRYERKGLAFHEKIRLGFSKIAVAEPNRCVVVDATAPVEKTAEFIWSKFHERYDGH